MTTASEATEHRIEAHSVRLEEPDLFIFRQVGALSEAEVRTFLDLIGQFVTGKSKVFAIIDQTQAGKVTSEARRLLLGSMPEAIVGMVFLGLSVMARVGISLGYKAYVMMNRGQEHAHMFAEDESQARAWIDQQRQRALP